jgi:aryl carrier-like protein
VVTLPDSTDPYNCLPRQWNQIVALFLQDTVFSAPISRIASLWERVGQLHAQIAMPAPRGYQDSINVALVLAMCAATVMECPLLAAEPCLAGLLETDAIAWSTQSSAALLESRKMQVEMMCGPPLINQTIDEIRTLYLLHRFRRFRHPMLASMDLASAIALAREVGIVSAELVSVGFDGPRPASRR